jgi:hypothetical protein
MPSGRNVFSDENGLLGRDPPRGDCVPVASGSEACSFSPQRDHEGSADTNERSLNLLGVSCCPPSGTVRWPNQLFPEVWQDVGKPTESCDECIRAIVEWIARTLYTSYTLLGICIRSEPREDFGVSPECALHPRLDGRREVRKWLR